MRISVTEMMDWQDCNLRWDYKYRRGIKLPEATSGPMLSGSSIHAGIETRLLIGGNAVEAAHDYLLTKGGEEALKRYGKGAATAIDGVPNYIWNLPYVMAEDKMEVHYPEATVVFKPDLIYMTDTALVVVDFKSTSSDEDQRLLSYDFFNMPIRFYAVLYSDYLRLQGYNPPPIYAQHLVLSTRGKHAEGVPFLVDLDQTRAHMLSVLRLISPTHTPPHYSTWSCNGCRYNTICKGVLTGASESDIIRSMSEEG